MGAIWMVLFLVSFLLLLLVILRSKGGLQALGYVAMNIVIAAFLLYFIDLFSEYTQFRLPINPATVLTIGILGVPGLMLLAAVKLFII